MKVNFEINLLRDERPLADWLAPIGCNRGPCPALKKPTWDYFSSRAERTHFRGHPDSPNATLKDGKLSGAT